MASNHTAAFGLNQWAATDPVLREDFNADNQKIEEALSAPPLYGKIREVVTTEAATQVEFDITDLDLAVYRILEFDLYIPGGDTLTAWDNAKISLYFNDTSSTKQTCYNSQGGYSQSIDNTLIGDYIAMPWQAGMPPTQIHLTLYPAPAGTVTDHNGYTGYRAMGGTTLSTYYDDQGNDPAISEFSFRLYTPSLSKLILQKKTTVGSLPAGTKLQIYGVRA